MKILYVATVGEFMPFFEKIIYELIQKGNTVDIAANTDLSSVSDSYSVWGCKVYNLSCTRSPFNIGTMKCITEIHSLVKKNKYDIVHCHTPIASFCARFACAPFRKNGLKVIYTAHGFHFYKGAPIKNWAIYGIAERLCAHYTDLLITINKEDYEWAKKNLRRNEVVYIPGVGIDYGKFTNTVIDRHKKREEIEINDENFLLLSVGELNDNKNHQVVLRALSHLDNRIHYAIAGNGENEEKLNKLASILNISERFHLLGYRHDVEELYKAADVFVLPSIREGLNVSIMEAMASGLPCIVTRIRGNVDMVDEQGGFLCNPFKVEEFEDSVQRLENGLLPNAGEYNRKKAAMFSSEKINREIIRLYSTVLKERGIISDEEENSSIHS